MRLSSGSSISRNTENDKFCNRRKAKYLRSRILWTLRSTSMVQLDDGYLLRTPHQEEESYTLL